MSKSKKTKSIILVLIIAVGLILYVFRVIGINNIYPNPSVEYIALGTPFDIGDNLILTIEDGNLLTPSEIESEYKELFHVNDYNWITHLGESKVFLVKVKIQNLGLTEVAIPAYNLGIACHNWHNGISGGLFDFLNEINEDSESSFALNPNSTKEFIMPYMVYEIQFSSKDDFNAINLQHAYLAPTLYPIKSCLLLN